MAGGATTGSLVVMATLPLSRLLALSVVFLAALADGCEHDCLRLGRAGRGAPRSVSGQ